MNNSKQLPNDLQAEMCALGAMILSSKAISVAAGSLDHKSFYKLAHQSIYKTIIDCSTEGTEIDITVLRSELKKAGKLEKVGGISYLRELVQAVPTAENIDYYVGITKEMAVRRLLINKTTEIQQAAYNEASDIDTLTNELQHLKNTSIIQDKIRRASDYLTKADERLAGTSTDFTATGNDTYDDLFGGFERGEYVVLSGFSGMGKTSYMNQCLIGALDQGGVPVGVFSSEISGARLCINLARTMSGLYIHARRDGTIAADELKAWKDAKELMQTDGFQYYLNDTSSIFIEDLHRLAKKMVDDYGVRVIGIDHLQRLRTRQNHNSEALRMKEISNRACEMARELDVTVIMLSQKTEGDGGKFQLRYATELFNDADKVLDLYQVCKCPIEDEPHVCERILAEKKGRNYGTAKLQGSFNKPGLRFDSWCKIF